jgi:hypothetical protein
MKAACQDATIQYIVCWMFSRHLPERPSVKLCAWMFDVRKSVGFIGWAPARLPAGYFPAYGYCTSLLSADPPACLPLHRRVLFSFYINQL